MVRRRACVLLTSTLGTVPGHRDELVATLTRRDEVLRELGCSLYEVGVHADAPDTVFAAQEAHRHFLESAQVQAAIAAARPILSGEFGGFRIDVVGSPRHLVGTWTAQTTRLLLAYLQAPPPAGWTDHRQPRVDSTPELALSADGAEAETAVDDDFRAGGEAGLG